MGREKTTNSKRPTTNSKRPITKSKRPITKSKRPTTKSKRPITKSKITSVKKKSKNPTRHPDSVVSLPPKPYAYPIGNPKSNKISDFHWYGVGNQYSKNTFYAYPVSNSQTNYNTASREQENTSLNKDPSGVYAEPVNKIIMKSGKRYMEKNGVQYYIANSRYGIRQQNSPSYEEIPTYLEPVKANKYARISNNGTTYVSINNSKTPTSKKPTKKPTSKKPNSKKTQSGKNK